MDESITYLGLIMIWWDLNDNEPNFYNTLMLRWGTYWKYELQITQALPTKVVKLRL